MVHDIYLPCYHFYLFSSSTRLTLWLFLQPKCVRLLSVRKLFLPMLISLKFLSHTMPLPGSPRIVSWSHVPMFSADTWHHTRRFRNSLTLSQLWPGLISRQTGIWQHLKDWFLRLWNCPKTGLGLMYNSSITSLYHSVSGVFRSCLVNRLLEIYLFNLLNFIHFSINRSLKLLTNK